MFKPIFSVPSGRGFDYNFDTFFPGWSFVGVPDLTLPSAPLPEERRAAADDIRHSREKEFERIRQEGFKSDLFRPY